MGGSLCNSEDVAVPNKILHQSYVERGVVTCAVEFLALVLDLFPTGKKTAAKSPGAISVKMRPGKGGRRGLCLGCWDERKYAPCNSNWSGNCIFS